MHVDLTPELEQLVQARLQSGHYHSPAEVLREALTLLEQRDELRAIRITELHSRMDRALAESDRGEGADGETFIERMLEDLDPGNRRNSG